MIVLLSLLLLSFPLLGCIIKKISHITFSFIHILSANSFPVVCLLFSVGFGLFSSAAELRFVSVVFSGIACYSFTMKTFH